MGNPEPDASFMQADSSVPNRLPLGLKIIFTAFMAVLVPVYWKDYGPTNFLYFCDMALFITLVAMWTENALLASMATVGIVIPQLFWCVDFAVELSGNHLSGMTGYMFDQNKSLFLRGLSLFHGWLPFVLLFMVSRMGYDRKAFRTWTAFSVVLCLIAYFLLPPAGAVLADPNLPRNVNYVFGLNDATPQQLMPQGVFLVVWMLTLIVLFYVPSHLILNRLFGKRTAR